MQWESDNDDGFGGADKKLSGHEPSSNQSWQLL
jgi:hypothetical protein